MSLDWNRYGPTAARPAGAKPGRTVRPKSITIDIHSHVAVPRAAEFVKPHLDLATVPLAHYATVDTKAINARQDAERRGVMTLYDQRIADLDAMGIDLQLVMCPPPQCYYTVPVDIAVEAAEIVNDGVAEYVASKPDRFFALGTVPMPDSVAAVSELERCMSALKFKGVQILTNVAGKELSDPAFAPFWAKAEALGAVVLIHPNGFTEAQRLSRFYFNNIVGNPLETTLALHYLIFDGVLERHPNLKIIAVHGGGFLGAYPGRTQRRPCRVAQAAVELSQEDLCRHGGFHAGPARRAGRDLRRRQRLDGHRLPLRHGRVRSDRASRRDEEPRPGRHCRRRRRQREEAVRVVAPPRQAGGTKTWQEEIHRAGRSSPR
jgi:aminocarboxymuconate-semialdehyde decarboxylase